MSNKKRIERLCNDRFPKSAVETRKNATGVALSYASQHYIISRMNSIFGPLGWSDRTRKLKRLQAIEEVDKNGKKRWRASYEAIVTVTIDYEDRQIYISKDGTGHGHGYGPSMGDACESAAKEAETDALKRACRKFGPSLGLALYDKEQEDVGLVRFAPDGEPIALAIDRAESALSQCVDKHMLWTTFEDMVRPLLLVLGDDARSVKIKKLFGETKKRVEETTVVAEPEAVTFTVQ